MYWPAEGGLFAHFVGANEVCPHTAQSRPAGSASLRERLPEGQSRGAFLKSAYKQSTRI